MGVTREYIGFSEMHRNAVERAVTWGRFLLDQVIGDLRVLYNSVKSASELPVCHFRVRDVEKIVKNNFDVDVYDKDRLRCRARLYILKENFELLRTEIAKPFPKVASRRVDLKDGEAFVSGPSPSRLAPIYFLPKFFDVEVIDQGALIVHELAHQKLQRAEHAHHPGMKPHETGGGWKPDEDKANLLGGAHFFHNAIHNPYCYQWLCLALSPQYNPGRYGAVEFEGAISGTPPSQSGPRLPRFLPEA